MSTKRIAIIMGGYSAEFDISVKSAHVVASNLSLPEYETYFVTITKDEWFCELDGVRYAIDKNDFSLHLPNGIVHFDGVFNAIHGRPGEDGHMNAYLGLLGIPVSGCSVQSASLTMSKRKTNDLLRNYGIPVANSHFIIQGDSYDGQAIVDDLGLPCFVKPDDSGSSYGISKVNQLSGLDAAIDEAFQHSSTVLIESYLNGSEFSCGVHNLNGFIDAFPLTEIISENEFFDFAAKYEGKSKEVTPAMIDDELAMSIQEIAKRVYALLDLNGVCRIDFILHDGEPFVVEANTVPGLSEASIIPQQALASGMSLNELFSKWIEQAMR